jgi:hypothetical protein
MNTPVNTEIGISMIFFFFYWYYNPICVLAFSIILFHSALSLHCFLYCLIPIIYISSSISTIHLFLQQYDMISIMQIPSLLVHQTIIVKISCLLVPLPFNFLVLCVEHWILRPASFQRCGWQLCPNRCMMFLTQSKICD